MMSKDKNMKALKINVPKQLLTELDHLKKVTGLPRAELIRRGLGMYVDYYKKKINPPQQSPPKQ